MELIDRVLIVIAILIGVFTFWLVLTLIWQNIIKSRDNKKGKE